MKHILLVNMGSPSSPKGMQQFLRRMLCDPAIVPAPAMVRYMLAMVVSRLRYKQSWGKYSQIGGSPLLSSMTDIKTSLSHRLGSGYSVSCGYSYSEPLVNDEIDRIVRSQVSEILVVPMYPQRSLSTTGSIERVVERARAKHARMPIKLIEEYSQNPIFLDYWATLAREQMAQVSFAPKHLLFSAHAIPEYHLLKGDTYTRAIERMARSLSDALGIPYSIAYQSKLGRFKWSSPDIYTQIRALKCMGCENILVAPISFISENLETLYDLDVEIIPYAREVIGIDCIDRIRIPLSHPKLIDALEGIVKEVC